MLYTNGLAISLDKREKGSDIDFVSHAHTDHMAAVRSTNNILASSGTVDLISSVHGIDLSGKEAQVDGRIRMLDAGHIFGSKQLVVEDEIGGNKITYSGDFQMLPQKASLPIEVEDTDILIIDSTYPDPSHRFPDKEEVESLIQEWAESMLKRGIVLFGAFATGKAQELIKILNEINVLPVVSKKISIVNKAYERGGVDLDYCSAYDDESEYGAVTRGNFVGITEKNSLRELKGMLGTAYKKEVFTAVATGMVDRTTFDAEARFVLSDHADFYQSTEYIDATCARKVLTYGPNASAFAMNLSKHGYDAMPFSKWSQKGTAKSIVDGSEKVTPTNGTSSQNFYARQQQGCI